MTVKRALIFLTLIGLALWLVLELALALTLRVEGYDGYWYLSNAWYLAGGPVSRYEITKAPLLSLLFWPFYLLRRLGAPEIVPFIASHVLTVTLTLATGLLLVRVLAATFPRSLAWAGGFAFLGSRIVFRYAAFAMSDLPATLAVLVCLEAARLSTSRDGFKPRLPLALGMAASILARYTAGLILPVVMVWDLAVLWRSSGASRRVARRLLHHLEAAALAGLTVALIHVAVYAVPFGGPAGMVAAFREMLARNARLGGISIRGLEPWWEYAPMLIRACTLPMVLFMGLGFVQALRRGGRNEWLHGLWTAVTLIFISLVSSHKEARYLLPALPSLIFFGLWGLRACGRMLEGLTRSWPPPWRWPSWGILFLLGVGFLGLFRETRQLAQPFFREPRAARLAAWVDEEVPPPGRLAWTGNFYPLFPPRHLFHAGDEYYYIFHLAPHVMEYYTGRAILSLRHLPTLRLAGVLYPVGAGTVLSTGDGLISSIPEVSITRRIPSDLPPLVLSRARIWDLPRQGSTGLFRAAGEALSARLVDGRELEIHTFPGPTEVLAHLRGGGFLTLGLFPGTEGTIHVETEVDAAARTDAIRLLRYGPQAVSSGPRR
ncbi:MAG: hypothetical protein ACE5ID_01695 [Acidobacteriota bacterium]